MSEKTIQFTDKSGNYLYPKIRTANAINDGNYLQVSDSGTEGWALVWTSQGPKWQAVVSNQQPLRYRNFTSSDVSQGKITLPQLNIPVGIETSAGNYYPVEKLSVELGVASVTVDLAAYLAYQGTPSVTGTWRVWFAGGTQDRMPLIETSDSIIPSQHHAYKIQLTSGMTVGIDTAGLISNTAVTFELWLDMPSTAVSFTLPSLTWIDGSAPSFTSGNTRYVVTVRWNGTKLLANLAYTESLA